LNTEDLGNHQGLAPLPGVLLRKRNTDTSLSWSAEKNGFVGESATADGEAPIPGHLLVSPTLPPVNGNADGKSVHEFCLFGVC